MLLRLLWLEVLQLLISAGFAVIFVIVVYERKLYKERRMRKIFGDMNIELLKENVEIKERLKEVKFALQH